MFVMHGTQRMWLFLHDEWQPQISVNWKTLKSNVFDNNDQEYLMWRLVLTENGKDLNKLNCFKIDYPGSLFWESPG